MFILFYFVVAKSVQNCINYSPCKVLGANSGQVGLAIMSSINLIEICEYGIRESTELENQMTSVERVVEYAKVESEPPLESDDKNAPPKNWPIDGNIEFKSLSMRYSETSAQILHKLTFRIDAKVRDCCRFLCVNTNRICIEKKIPAKNWCSRSYRCW